MRCHPALSFPLERVVPEGGTEICGAKLPSGTVVGINPVVTHHDTSIYGADAASFRPERWLDSDPEQIKIMDRNLLTVSFSIPSARPQLNDSLQFLKTSLADSGAYSPSLATDLVSASAAISQSWRWGRSSRSCCAISIFHGRLISRSGR